MLLIHECNAQLTEINQAWWGMQLICDSPTLSHSLLAALRVRSRLHNKWTIYSRLCLQETYLLKITYPLCPRLCLILCSPSSILFSDLQSAPARSCKSEVCVSSVIHEFLKIKIFHMIIHSPPLKYQLDVLLTCFFPFAAHQSINSFCYPL